MKKSLILHRSCFLVASCLLVPVVPSVAQTVVLPPSSVPSPAVSFPQGTKEVQATLLTGQALEIAYRNPEARAVAIRTAAALLPRLASESAVENGMGRDGLTTRWLQLAMTDDVPRNVRLDAFGAFFDVASKVDPDFGATWAPRVPDAAARAGAFLDLSRGVEASNWTRADEYAALAQRAARQEEELTPRARALVFIAYRMSELSPARTEEAIREASSQVALIQTPAVRDNLYAELVGAAARFDLGLARTMAERITDEGLKNLASARINIAEVSQSTITSRSKERVQALATAAAPYDSRALPFLLQLPPDESVLKAISETLPRIYVTARPAIEVSQLEQIWEYSKKAPEGAYRDQLQSRLARLLVLKDLWRGRSWGKELSWKGGRIQVGAFLKEVLEYRQSQLQAGALQDVAKRNVEAAYRQALGLPAPEQAEALLLLAGQILDSE